MDSQAFLRPRNKIDYRNSGNLISRFILAIALCFIATAIMQYFTFSMVKKDLRDRNSAILKTASDIVDVHLEEARRLSLLLLRNPNINEYISQEAVDPGSPSIQKVIDAQQTLNSLKSLNPLILDIYIYSKASDYLLSAENAFLDLSKVYDNLLAFEGYSLEQWRHQFLKKPDRNRYHPMVTALVRGLPKEVIPFGQSFPLGNPIGNTGKVIMLLSGSYLSQLLARQDLGEHGWSYMIDMEGNVLGSYKGEQRDSLVLIDSEGLQSNGEIHREVTINGERCIVFETRTELSGLKMVSVLPLHDIRNRINYQWIVFAVVSLALLIALSIYALVIIGTQYRQWNSIRLLVLDGGSGGKASYIPYEEVRQRITEIVSSTKGLPGNKQELPIRDHFCHRLLGGGFTNEEELRTFISYNRIEVPTEDRYFQVGLVTLGDRDEPMVLHEQLEDLAFIRMNLSYSLEELFSTTHLLYHNYRNDTQFIVWDSDKTRLTESVRRLWEQIHSACPNPISMYVSSVKNSLISSTLSQLEVNQTKHCVGKSTGTGFYRYEDLPGKEDTFHYPMEIENRLVNSVLRGDTTDLMKLLDDLQVANFHQRTLTKEALQSFKQALHRSACRLHEQLPHTIPLCGSFGTFDEASSQFLRLCQHVNDRKNDKNLLLQESIRKYIEENFSNPLLNLATVAHAMQQKESSLYYFFTRHMRTSFAQYVEEFRLEQARGMLLQDYDRPINEIAQAVGYANPQTFRRAFKKHQEITPSAYRDLNA